MAALRRYNPMMKRLFGKLRDLSFDKGQVTIHWSDNRTSTIPLVWLRDNVENGQRAKLAQSMKVQTLTLDEKKDKLSIKWKDRGTDTYTGDWLEARLINDPLSLKSAAATPLTAQDIEKPFVCEQLNAIARKSAFETLLKTGFLRFSKQPWKEVLQWLFNDTGNSVQSRCGELHTEGAFHLEVPKFIILSITTPTKLRLLDVHTILASPQLQPVLPLMANVCGSFECRTDSLRFRATHPLLKNGKIVYSEQWRDTSVRDREFYAVTGHFHQYLSEAKEVLDTQLDTGDTVFIDNHRVMHDRDPRSSAVTAVSLTLAQGEIAAEGFEMS